VPVTGAGQKLRLLNRRTGMRRKLVRIGNSRGLVLPKEMLELLGLEPGGEAEVQVIGNTLVATPAGADEVELRAAPTYFASKRERTRLYKKLSDA